MGRHASGSSDSDRKHSSHKKSQEDKDKKRHKDKDRRRHKERSPRSEEAERERALVKEAKRFLKRKLKESDGGAAAPAAAQAAPATTIVAGVTPIAEDDFFLRNAEFSTWLREARGTFFGELASDASKALFAEFVSLWNAGRLPEKFYRGGAAEPAAAPRTAHQWGFQGAGALAPDVGGDDGSGFAAPGGRGAARAAAELERKKARREEKEWLEEIAPKASGREAAAEQKRAARDVARAADADRGDFLVPGGDVMGGGDDYGAARAAEAQRGARRAAHQSARSTLLDARLAEAAAKEAERMAQFRALLGAGPIQIPKRAPQP
jgi:hypothetical protein